MSNSLLPQNNYFNGYCNSLHAKTELYINDEPVSSSVTNALLNSQVGVMSPRGCIVADGGSHVNCHASNNLLIDDVDNNVTVTNALLLPYNAGSSCVSLDINKQLISRPLLNGQMLIGSTGAVPAVANLTAGSGISISNSAGGITITNTGSAPSADTLLNPVGGNMTQYQTLRATGSSHQNAQASPQLLLNDSLNQVHVVNNAILDYANASTLPVLNSSKSLQSVALTNGQLLIGSTGVVPVASGITAGSGISVTNGAGSITIAATGSSGNAVINSSPATAPVAGALWVSNASSNFAGNVNNTILGSASTISITNGSNTSSLNTDGSGDFIFSSAGQINLISAGNNVNVTGNISVQGPFAINCLTGSNQVFGSPDAGSYFTISCQNAGVATYSNASSYNFDSSLKLLNGSNVSTLSTDGSANLNIDVPAGNINVNPDGRVKMNCTVEFDANGHTCPVYCDSSGNMNIESTDGDINMSPNGNVLVNTNLVQTNINDITANRPISPVTGQQFFDTTLGYPIYWNGAIWINALGVGV